jgi:hypothetical protein
VIVREAGRDAVLAAPGCEWSCEVPYRELDYTDTLSKGCDRRLNKRSGPRIAGGGRGRPSGRTHTELRSAGSGSRRVDLLGGRSAFVYDIVAPPRSCTKTKSVL